MPRYGIPAYRLPFDRLDADIDVIRSVGVDIVCNSWIGKDISLQQLHQDNDAVLLALGLQLGRSTRIPGSDNHNVLKAVSLLRMIADEESFEVPVSAVVVGGGNVAMDIARSLARLQKKQFGKVDVTVSAMESFEHFLADPEEVKEAREEGVTILASRGPQECIVENDKLKALRSWGVVSIFDEQGRFAPQFDEKDEQLHDCCMVVEAIGQMSDIELLGEELTEKLEWQRGRLQVDENCRTSQDWLWAAGDMVKGPDVVHAVADGHLVSQSIANYLEAKATKGNLT
jgi:glutamate synthase (NADPH/NADH) small chain